MYMQGCIVEFESGPANVRQLSAGDTQASGPGVPTARAGWVREGRSALLQGEFGGPPPEDFS